MSLLTLEPAEKTDWIRSIPAAFGLAFLLAGCAVLSPTCTYLAIEGVADALRREPIGARPYLMSLSFACFSGGLMTGGALCVIGIRRIVAELSPA